MTTPNEPELGWVEEKVEELDDFLEKHTGKYTKTTPLGKTLLADTLDVRKDIAMDKFRTALTTVLAEREVERDRMYKATNIIELVTRMENELEEDGDMHDNDCPCNMEDPDACDCETMRWAKMRCKEWMGKVNEMWAQHLKAHRQHCTPIGRKDLTLSRALSRGVPLDRRSD